MRRGVVLYFMHKMCVCMMCEVSKNKILSKAGVLPGEWCVLMQLKANK